MCAPTARWCWRATPTRPTCCRSSPTRVCGRKAIAPSCCRAARSPRCTTAAWRTTAPLRGLDDLQIYSREALPAITRYLAESLGVTFITGTLARAVEQGRVATTAGEFRGDHVFVCPGHDYLTLLPERFAPLNLEVTRLQMLRAAFESAPFALDRPLLTGLSCVHYGAFSDLPSALALREVIQARTPMLLDNGIHLLVSPTPYGELIIGDSHQYGQDAPPFNDEAVDNAMLDLASQALGARLRVVERWQGVYGARPGAVLGHAGGRRDHGRRDALGRGHDGGPGDRRAHGGGRHRTLKPGHGPQTQRKDKGLADIREALVREAARKQAWGGL